MSIKCTTLVIASMSWTSNYSSELIIGSLMRYIYETLKDMHLVPEDEKSEHAFYAKSGYNKKINQLTCGLTIGDLLTLVHGTYTEYKKKNTDVIYPDFKSVIDTFSDLFIRRADEVH